jgi:outer membrane protein assembly factor BamD (BamD/ComL family)
MKKNIRIIIIGVVIAIVLAGGTYALFSALNTPRTEQNRVEDSPTPPAEVENPADRLYKSAEENLKNGNRDAAKEEFLKADEAYKESQTDEANRQRANIETYLQTIRDAEKNTPVAPGDLELAH